MQLELKRYSDNGISTQGLLFIDNKFFCHALEDAGRDVKIKSKTCIKAGTYKLKIRKVDSDLTLHYKKLFSWFKFHIQLMDVPDFKYVYLHSGNDSGDTDGCILLGNCTNSNSISKGSIWQSVAAYKRFYLLIYDILLDQDVYITITN